MKTYSYSQVKEMGLDIRKDAFAQKAILIADLVSNFVPANAYFGVSENSTEKIVTAYAVIEHPFLKLNVYIDSKKDQYVINCNFNEFRNVENSTIENVSDSFEKPKNIGVFTLKKINEWISYYEKVHEILSKKDAENLAQKQAFFKSIEGLPVRWSDNNTTGEIIRGGIVLTFRVEKEFISQKMKIDSLVLSGLETFLKMSDNKLNQK